MSGRASRPDTQADKSVRECLERRQSFLMIAGAGSGKTTSLIKSLTYLGKQHGTTLRRNGQKIACITYTNVAVGEIRSDVGMDELFQVSTIHSFLWEIARPFQREIRAWVVEHIQEKIDELKDHNAKPRTHRETIGKNDNKIRQYNDTLGVIDKVGSFRYETDRRYAEGVLGHADIIKMVPQLLTKYQLLRKVVARKYPFVFVDESQDTDKEFVSSLKMIDQDEGERFCLGFFGDPMQQIYATGIGLIPKENNWQEITKEENFRSSKAVLEVINRIRKDGDGLEQTDGLAALSSSGSRAVPGSARLFIIPADDNRRENTDRIRNWLASTENDPLWRHDSPAADVKVLVLLHRMAADRLGFPDLFRALDRGPDSFKTGFTEGTLWVSRPFQQTLMPLVEAVSQGNKYQVINLLREAKSPLLSHERLSLETNPAHHLSSIKGIVDDLAHKMPPTEDSGATVKECLQLVRESKLVPLDDRLVAVISGNMTAEALGGGKEDKEDEWDKKLQAIEAFLSCPVSQLWHYRRYLDGDSPYSTQHGVKGAEFDRVLVVLDDEEGKGFSQFSYEQLFGLKDPSGKKSRKSEEGEGSKIDRTRRLFYVCCSRARKDLAVVLFIQDVQGAREKLANNGIFKENAIFCLEDLTTS
ncbi:MAG: ATP-dependent helicase [Magnetococcales bacterium]|nr:ATP-dependent helicase [Magnetococcales bacterium]